MSLTTVFAVTGFTEMRLKETTEEFLCLKVLSENESHVHCQEPTINSMSLALKRRL